MMAPTGRIIHPAPTFTINNVKGWQTRLLFSYYSHVDNTLQDLVGLAGGNYTQNIFDTLITLAGASVNPYKGDVTFPSRYFCSGKNLRVQGQFVVSAESPNRKFNIRAEIVNSNTGNANLANQNNNNDHIFSIAEPRSLVPVYFNIVYTSAENPQSPAELYMTANGHYMYEFDSYNSGGFNNSVVYVPIYNIAGGNQYYFIVENPPDGTNRLNINFGTSNIDKIYLSYLTVEELQ